MAKQRITKGLNVEDVEALAFSLAQGHLTFDEPIPDFSTRFANSLESCINVPFQKFFGKTAYPSLVRKAGILFYLLIKDHPFQNGNKRIAITTLLVFLLKNGKWLKADLRDFYEFTIWLAKSKAKDKEYIVMAIEGFINRHLRPESVLTT